jgi:7-cyano-7-deazaguanine synthase in queuosine biosynthesis
MLNHYYCLFSGGFDSTLAILKTVSENSPLRLTSIFFNYGQKASVRESETVMALFPRIKVFANDIDKNTLIDQPRIINIPCLFSWSSSSILSGNPQEGDAGVENRNLILLSCLSSVIMADKKNLKKREKTIIITGFTNSYYDTSLKFRNAINDFFKATKQHIIVSTPLIPENQKGEVNLDELIKIAKSLNILPLLNKMTLSCYFPSETKTCGECDQCKKRYKINQALN